MVAVEDIGSVDLDAPDVWNLLYGGWESVLLQSFDERDAVGGTRIGKDCRLE